MPKPKTSFVRELRNSPTESERKLWYFLRRRQMNGHKFRRQFPIGPYVVDFYCAEKKLIIEVDGGQHTERRLYDCARTKFLSERGCEVLRFWNHEVLRETDAVLDRIRLGLPPPDPSPISWGRARVGAIITTFLLLACPGFAAQPVRIEKVSVSPKTIDVSKNEKAVIRFETTREAFLTVTFRDENMNMVKRKEIGLQKAGKQAFEWDGKGDNGEFVKTDAAIYSIDARTEDSQYATFDPSGETGGIDLKFSEFTFDKETGKIEYVLPQASRVRLRAGLGNGALLKTVFDWKAEEAGRHEFAWDGLDKSGAINLLKHSSLNLNLNAFSLPDNAVIIHGNKVDYPPPDSVFQAVKEDKHFHYPHPRITCHEPRFSISFAPHLNPPPAQRGEAGGGAPASILPHKVGEEKGGGTVTVTIDPADEVDLVRKRFEVMVYLDTNFLFEEEQGVSPSTFMVDFSKVTPGEHLLTVNVMSYDDHVGVETIKVNVQS